MWRNDVRFAVAAREDGLRRVRSLTTRIGAAGVVSSAAIALALGHPAGPAIQPGAGNGTASPSQTGPNENSPSSSTSPGNSANGNSPPGSSPPGKSPPHSAPPRTSPPRTSEPSSSPQAPAQTPVPAAGSGQVVSGGS